MFPSCLGGGPITWQKRRGPPWPVDLSPASFGMTRWKASSSCWEFSSATYGQGWPRLRRLKGFSFLFPVGDGMAVVIPMVLGCELMRLKALQKRSGSVD